jgi:hypothetical protein
MSDVEELNYDSDEEVADNHAQLLDAVRQLDKAQRYGAPSFLGYNSALSLYPLIPSASFRHL